MPFYNWNTKHNLLPCAEIYDANGQRISHVLQCETETGRVIRQVRSDDGSCEHDANGESIQVLEVRAAPLVVNFAKHGGLSRAQARRIADGMERPYGWHAWFDQIQKPRRPAAREWIPAATGPDATASAVIATLRQERERLTAENARLREELANISSR